MFVYLHRCHDSYAVAFEGEVESAYSGEKGYRRQPPSLLPLTRGVVKESG